MTISRKEFLTGVGAVTLTGAMSGTVTWADDYPNQDIHLICGFPPGSGADVLVRYYGEKLRPVSGRNIIVENRTGANSNIATEYVARRAHRTRLRPCSRRRSSNGANTPALPSCRICSATSYRSSPNASTNAFRTSGGCP